MDQQITVIITKTFLLKSNLTFYSFVPQGLLLLTPLPLFFKSLLGDFIILFLFFMVTKSSKLTSDTFTQKKDA